MKRCPECLFIYPDADARCDFDNTALVVVDEAELAAATNAPATPAKQKRTSKKKTSAKPSNTANKAKTPRKRQGKTTTLTAVVGLLLGVSAFTAYYRLSSRPQHIAQIQPPTIGRNQPFAAPIDFPSPLPTASPSPTAIPTPAPKPTTDRIATAHSGTTVAPISTSGPGMGKRAGAKPTILLNSGSKIDADEIWRTRDGVWYRRDGIVTLLKRGQVRAIVNQ